MGVAKINKKKSTPNVTKSTAKLTEQGGIMIMGGHSRENIDPQSVLLRIQDGARRVFAATDRGRGGNQQGYEFAQGGSGSHKTESSNQISIKLLVPKLYYTVVHTSRRRNNLESVRRTTFRGAAGFLEVLSGKLTTGTRC